METALLVRESDFDHPHGGGPLPPMSVTEMYDLLETKRMVRLDGLVQKYGSIQGLLIKVRGVSSLLILLIPVPRSHLFVAVSMQQWLSV